MGKDLNKKEPPRRKQMATRHKVLFSPKLQVRNQDRTTQTRMANVLTGQSRRALGHHRGEREPVQSRDNCSAVSTGTQKRTEAQSSARRSEPHSGHRAHTRSRGASDGGRYNAITRDHGNEPISANHSREGRAGGQSVGHQT